MLGITDDSEKRNNNRKRKKRGVSFNEDEEIINPEDVDPSIGRFRNLIQTTVIPTAQKRARLSDVVGVNSADLKLAKHLHPSSIIPHLYQDLPPETNTGGVSSSMNIYSSLSSRLGMVLPNPAPEVDLGQSYPQAAPYVPVQSQSVDSLEPKKKKYAKEAWPGKKPAAALF